VINEDCFRTWLRHFQTHRVAVPCALLSDGPTYLKNLPALEFCEDNIQMVCLPGYTTYRLLPLDSLWSFRWGKIRLSIQEENKHQLYSCLVRGRRSLPSLASGEESNLKVKKITHSVGSATLNTATLFHQNWVVWCSVKGVTELSQHVLECRPSTFHAFPWRIFWRKLFIHIRCCIQKSSAKLCGLRTFPFVTTVQYTPQYGVYWILLTCLHVWLLNMKVADHHHNTNHVRTSDDVPDVKSMLIEVWWFWWL